MRGRWSQWNTSLAPLIQPVHFPGQRILGSSAEQPCGEGGEAGQGGRQVAAEDAEDPSPRAEAAHPQRLFPSPLGRHLQNTHSKTKAYRTARQQSRRVGPSDTRLRVTVWATRPFNHILEGGLQS